MKKIALSVCLFAAACTSSLRGQDPVPTLSPSDVPAMQGTIPGISPGQMTPEMYLYLHEQRRYDDPKQAVRRKAEIKTAQRMQRMAAQKWFGVSNARPSASAQPFMDMYSPRWIGNGYNAFDWAGVNGNGVTVIQVEPNTVRR
jgi:hypothetical protein